MTDCIICFEAISAKTGKSILSCGHEFHLKCIVAWLQKPYSSCPCCRASPGEFEWLSLTASSESESESEDDSATPLMHAILNANYAEIHRLIGEGPDLHACDSDGDTALIYAVLYNEDVIVGSLLRAGANILDLSKLIGIPANVDNPLGAALLGSCQYNCLSAAKEAINKGADPNYAHPTTGITPLMEIVRDEGSVEIVSMLLEKGADIKAVDKVGKTVFDWFEIGCKDPRIRALLDYAML
jgi:hypothetical protein